MSIRTRPLPVFLFPVYSHLMPGGSSGCQSIVSAGIRDRSVDGAGLFVTVSHAALEVFGSCLHALDWRGVRTEVIVRCTPQRRGHPGGLRHTARLASSRSSRSAAVNDTAPGGALHAPVDTGLACMRHGHEPQATFCRNTRRTKQNLGRLVS